jgi:hypothetical protein
MDTFSKEETNILKGVAILFMLFFHLFNKYPIGNLYEPSIFIGGKPLSYLLSSCTYPVDFFIILSGYGLYISYCKGKNNNVKRNIKLYIHYWITLLIFVTLGFFIKGQEIYPGDFQKIILNITALKTTYNFETWFLFPYMLLSLSSYYLFKFFDKVRPILLFLVLLAISLISQSIIHFYTEYVNSNIILDQLLPYLVLLFPFSLGMFMAKYCKYKQIKNRLFTFKYINLLLIISILVIMGMMMLLQDYHLSMFQPFYSIVFILFFIFLKRPTIINRFLVEMGHRSTSMWFIHTYFCYYIFHDFIYGFKYPIAIYLMLVLISYLLAIIIDIINKKINNILITNKC